MERNYFNDGQKEGKQVSQDGIVVGIPYFLNGEKIKSITQIGPKEMWFICDSNMVFNMYYEKEPGVISQIVSVDINFAIGKTITATTVETIRTPSVYKDCYFTYTETIVNVFVTEYKYTIKWAAMSKYKNPYLYIVKSSLEDYKLYLRNLHSIVNYDLVTIYE